MTASSPPGLGPEEVAERWEETRQAALKGLHASNGALNSQRIKAVDAAIAMLNALPVVAPLPALLASLASLDATAARVVELEAALKFTLEIIDKQDSVSGKRSIWRERDRLQAARALSVSPDGDRPEQETKS